LKIFVNEVKESVTGSILRISPIIDPASSLIKIDILVENKNGFLRSGMLGYTSFENESSSSTYERKK
jgi:hypothetical protein